MVAAQRGDGKKRGRLHELNPVVVDDLADPLPVTAAEIEVVARLGSLVHDLLSVAADCGSSEPAAASTAVLAVPDLSSADETDQG